MPNAAQKRKLGAAIVIRESAETVRGPICKMHPWSDCGKHRNDNPDDQWRRDTCDTDYETLKAMVRDGLVTDKELEDIGMWSPVKRQTQKRVLSAVLARRNTN